MPLIKTLFSQVNGIVLDHGKPLPGIVVVRRVQHAGKDKIDITTTDSNGTFAFKPLKGWFSLFDLVPHETVITQRLTLKISEKEYKAWICVKRDYDDRGELEGKPINIVCDIKNEYKDNGAFMGMCRLQ